MQIQRYSAILPQLLVFTRTPCTRHKTFELFQDLNGKELTLIIVTHNVELAKIANKIIQLRYDEPARMVLGWDS